MPHQSSLRTPRVKSTSTGRSKGQFHWAFGLRGEKAKTLGRSPPYRRRLMNLPLLPLSQFYLWELLSQDTCHAAFYLWVNTVKVVFGTGPLTGAHSLTQIANPWPTLTQNPNLLDPMPLLWSMRLSEGGQISKEDTSGLVADQPYLSYVSWGSQLDSLTLNFLHYQVLGLRQVISATSSSSNNLNFVGSNQTNHFCICVAICVSCFLPAKSTSWMIPQYSPTLIIRRDVGLW